MYTQMYKQARAAHTVVHVRDTSALYVNCLLLTKQKPPPNLVEKNMLENI